MSLVPVKYPLDLTGAAASNRVQDEAHELGNAHIRICVPHYGAFFTDSIALRDAATNRVLRKGVDYYPSVLYTLPTEQTGREVHQILVITDATCGPNVLFDAQMLGGEYSYSYDAIVQLVQRLGIDGRPIEFDNIIGKPDSFAPAPHLHDAGDVYGFEYLTSALDRVTDALKLGSAGGQKAIYDYLKARLTEIQISIDLLRLSRNSASSIIAALNYTPMNKAGGDITGPVSTMGVYNQANVREKTRSVTVVAATTTLDLSVSNRFVVTLNLDTTLKLDVLKIAGLAGTDSMKFSMLVKNDTTAGRKLLFPASVVWPNKTEPTRSTAASAINEYEFTTYDGGVKWYGKLTGANFG